MRVLIKYFHIILKIIQNYFALFEFFDITLLNLFFF